MVSTRTILRAGQAHALTCDDTTALLDVIRTALGVTSVSRGCEDGSCGACRALVDGEVVNTCRVAWADVRDGARVETYEDVERDPAAVRAVAAFQDERPTRCALCTGALAVTAVALARAGRAGDGDAIDAMLVHATCMCTGRGSLRRALHKID